MATRKTSDEIIIPAAEFDELTEQANMGRVLMTQPPEDEPEPETAADRVASMLNEVGSDTRAVVKLYRVTGPNKFAWCDEYSPADFEAGGIKMIREQFGPGNYDVRLYGMRDGRDGYSKFGVRAKERLDIEPSKVVSAATQQSNEFSRVLEAMQAQQTAMLEALTKRPEPADPTAQMMGMFTMMKAMREAMGDTGQRKSEIGEIVAAMRELREVSSEFSPEKDTTGDPLTDALPQVLQLIQSAMAQRQHGEHPQMLPPVALPVSMAPVAEPFDELRAGELDHVSRQTQINNPIAEDQNIMLAQLKAYLADLLKAAAAGSDAVEQGDVVYEKAPDEIIEIMALPNWFDMLAQFEPACTPHKAWFEAVHARVFALLDEDKQA